MHTRGSSKKGLLRTYLQRGQQPRPSGHINFPLLLLPPSLVSFFLSYSSFFLIFLNRFLLFFSRTLQRREKAFLRFFVFLPSPTKRSPKTVTSKSPPSFSCRPPEESLGGGIVYYVLRGTRTAARRGTGGSSVALQKYYSIC